MPAPSVFCTRPFLAGKRQLLTNLCKTSVDFKQCRNMRLLRFQGPTGPRLAAERKDGHVVDLNACAELELTTPGDTIEFLTAGPALWETAERSVKSGKHALRVNDKCYLAPLLKSDKVIGVCSNYADHCVELGVPVPVEPVLFSKFSSCLVGPTSSIHSSSETQTLDWEVELAVVIGKQGKNIVERKAMSHVFGYTVAHDVSERTWQLQKNSGQFLIGKAMDSFCPIGPVIVSKDEIADPHNLTLRTKVNGILKQDSNTSQLVHRIPALITFISRFFTLLPGDIILTGTPPGVGCFMKPPQYLKEGDVVECEVEGIGCIRNAVRRPDAA
ncbi:PREDICTED: fumarylacetoacetate hydrolase domain-containing protein 2-like isoform X2 [Priapulus caudatus]|uniref:Fumarylacetoacetate hydrolase domain-containing protein 2-like isoform X2 n=1 Tax=Priapulus caudatus TaxID=37621 RepID=A0ABM1EUW3_PRICU|nr:PREDICTED: fumarylacetoacetate hydrolase domain-containing protein 2-like isoform X2 [Priapulus caudatus]